MTSTNILETLLQSENPLPDDILDILVCQEESIYHDFKATIDIQSEREWLMLTKDFLSFVNTFGGYIAFGIKNNTKEKIGLNGDVFNYLLDPNNILQKVNKHIKPEITLISIKRIDGEKKFIVLHIPAIKNTTVIVEENGVYKDSGGKDKVILYKGEIYIRRSGQSLVTSHGDFEQLILRRMNGFRELIFENVAKTIREIAPGQQIIIAAENADSAETLVYKYSDSPNALEIKGAPTTVAPKDLKDALCTAISLFKHETGSLPSESLLYGLYIDREEIKIQEDYLPFLVRFCIIKNVPLFYWLNLIKKEIAVELFQELFKTGNRFNRDLVLRLSWFVDKSLFRNLNPKNEDGYSLEEVKKYNGYNLFISSYLLDGHSLLKGIKLIFEEPDEKLLTEANKLALKLKEKLNNKENDRLWALDCRLFASKMPGRLSRPADGE
jgi:hypothetical protein